MTAAHSTSPEPETTNPVDLAMQEVARDTAADSPARRLIDEQLLLVRAQRRTEALTQFDRRAAAVLKVLSVVVGLVFASALGAMAWSASQDRSLVITALQAPPDLVARGLIGEVLSGQLLDKIAAIDAQAQSFRAPETFRNDWGGEIEVEIPQTGVSIAEIDRYLRQWLGKRIGIGGEVFREPGGLALTVRAGSAGAVTVRGADAELDAMLQRAAEGVFEKTQPFRYSKYLEFSDRPEEAMAVARDLAENGPAPERPWAWAQISNLLGNAGDYAGAAAAGRRSTELDPDQGLGWLNRSFAEFMLGHEEAGAHSARRSVELLRTGRGGVSGIATEIGAANEFAIRSMVRDHAGALAAFNQHNMEGVDYLGLQSDQPALHAMELIMLHEPGRSARLAGVRTDLEMLERVSAVGDLLAPAYAWAAELGDWAGAAAELEQVDAAAERKGPVAATARERIVRPRLAHAYAMLGRADEARTLLRGNPRDCYRCLRLEGQALNALGDARGSERAFAEAARQAPSLPSAHGEWGEARLLRGDAAGALPLLREAQRRGPRWADPLKWEGDALARQGKHDAAVRKFEAAAERAPRWGALHLAWGRSLEALGRDEQARIKYGQAARLDLSAVDKAAVQRLQAPAA